MEAILKINIVILQPAKNLDLKDVILSEAKNLFLSFQLKNQKGDPSDLRPQDDSQRLIDKYQIKDNPFCHSAAGEESHTFIEFLTRRI